MKAAPRWPARRARSASGPPDDARSLRETRVVDVRGARVVVTGAAGGIGRALTTAFRQAGASVLTVDLPGTGADHEIDITDLEAVEATFGSLGRLDVLVANAGVGIAGRVTDLPPSDWEHVIDVNIRGTLNTVLAALPLLRSETQAALVVMASLSGLVGTPLLAPYAMTKHALVGLGTSLRAELGAVGIGVTVVCPGPVETALLDERSATPGMDVRRYLTGAAGKPLSAQALAAKVVAAVEGERSVVVPGRAGVIWRLQRLSPRLVGRQLARNMRNELRRAE